MHECSSSCLLGFLFCVCPKTILLLFLQEKNDDFLRITLLEMKKKGQVGLSDEFSL